MTPDHKEDIVCAFHNDLEKWMEKIDAKLDELIMWKIKVVAYAAGASVVIVFVSKQLGYIR